MVHIPDRGLAGIYKECLQINKKKQKKKPTKKQWKVVKKLELTRHKRELPSGPINT